MEKIIGLMGAMREEIALLCERMTDKGEETVAGVRFTQACCRDAVWRFAARASAR